MSRQMCIRSSAEYSASSCSIVLSYALTGIGEKAIVSPREYSIRFDDDGLGHMKS